MTKILIVEDDPQIRSMLEETLKLEGFETAVAENGNDALEKYGSVAPDLIITDILMPEKEGLGLITELKKTKDDVKIIAISGGAPSISPGCNLELAQMFGAHKTFQKPLDIDALLDTIRELVG